MKVYHMLYILLSAVPVVQADTTGTIGQAVVELHITRKTTGELTESRFRQKIEKFGKAVCSGAFIDSAGDIITAGHCAADAAEIEVVTYDQQHYSATIVATSSIHDLALLHIDRQNTDHFKPATTIERGEKVSILGSPLGIPNTLSTGIIAKLDGDVTLLDCGALPGNSGSAVWDANGDLVGVLTAGYVVGMGTTHLNVMQSADAVWFFLARGVSGVRQ